MSAALSLATKLHQYWRRPRLGVYSDAAETYHVRAVIDANGAPGYFCHVMVANDSREVARSCQGSA